MGSERWRRDREGLARASLAVYNTLEEVDFFDETLERAVKLLS